MPSDKQLRGAEKWAIQYQLGLVALENGETQKALELLAEALKIAEKHELDEAFINTRLTIADAHKILGNFDFAFSLYDHIMVEVSRKPALDAYGMIAEGNMGMLLIAKGDTRKAALVLESAVKKITKLKDKSKHPELISIIMGLGALRLESGQIEKAQKVFNYALGVAQEVLGPADAMTVTIMNFCALCAESLGDTKKAAALHQEMEKVMAESLNDPQMDELGIGKFMSRLQKGKEGAPPAVRPPNLSIARESKKKSAKGGLLKLLPDEKSNVIPLKKGMHPRGVGKDAEKTAEELSDAWEKTGVKPESSDDE